MTQPETAIEGEEATGAGKTLGKVRQVIDQAKAEGWPDSKTLGAVKYWLDD